MCEVTKSVKNLFNLKKRHQTAITHPQMLFRIGHFKSLNLNIIYPSFTLK